MSVCLYRRHRSLVGSFFQSLFHSVHHYSQVFKFTDTSKSIFSNLYLFFSLAINRFSFSFTDSYILSNIFFCFATITKSSAYAVICAPRLLIFSLFCFFFVIYFITIVHMGASPCLIPLLLWNSSVPVLFSLLVY